MTRAGGKKRGVPIAPVYRTIGKWVRDHRKQRRLTQAELGAKLGLSPSAISAIEAGRQQVAVHQLLELERVIG